MQPTQQTQQNYSQEERVFIQRAVMNGFNQNEIEAEVQRKRRQAQQEARKESFGGKAISGFASTLPTALALAGGFGGGVVGNIPGAAVGVGAGVAGGRALEDMILQAAGLKQTETPEEAKGDIGESMKELWRGDVGGATREAGTSALLTLLLGGAGKVVGKALKPTRVATKFLEKSRVGSKVPKNWEKILKNTLRKDTSYQALGPKEQAFIARNKGAGELAQEEIRSSLKRLVEMTSGSGKGDLNTIYKTLPAIKDRLTGQYAETGKQILDRVVREATNPYQGAMASKVGVPLYQAVKTLQPEQTMIAGLKRGIGWMPWVAAGYPLGKKVWQGITGGDK